MIAARSHGRTAAERLAAKKARQEQRKAKSAGAAGGQGPNGQTPMLPLVPQFDSFGRPVTSPSAAARDPYAIPKKSGDKDPEGPRIVLSQGSVQQSRLSSQFSVLQLLNTQFAFQSSIF